MSSPLAASFHSDNSSRNFCLPGETITFTFPQPPSKADDVSVSVLETINFLRPTTWSPVTDRMVGGFKGRIRNRKLEVSSVLGAPPPAYPDPVTICIAENMSPGARHVFAYMPEPERVATHQLRLRVEGRVDGKKEVFEGRHFMNVEYPMAMVVPVGGALHDPALNFIRSWAGQWKTHKSIYRQFFLVPLNRRTGPIAHSEYDAWITAMTAAAQFARAGVVAMATGHGDDGDGGVSSIAWCNSVPEDSPPPLGIIPSTYRLTFNDVVMTFGRSTVAPTGDYRIKLHALDRLADALADTQIRRILLHTCRAGASKGRPFVQMLADRIRVPVMGHTETIEYDGAPGSGTIAAHYEDVPIVRPRDEHEWPIHHVMDPICYPGTPPTRHGPGP